MTMVRCHDDQTMRQCRDSSVLSAAKYRRSASARAVPEAALAPVTGTADERRVVAARLAPVVVTSAQFEAPVRSFGAFQGLDEFLFAVVDRITTIVLVTFW